MDFVKFEEALKKLGISSERLNELREAGELRAYRDGPSWKFRADEVDRMASEGVPDQPPPSDVGLPSLDELVNAETLGDLSSLVDDELKLADDDADETDETSELELADLDLEDTVTATEEAKALPLADDENDSILLSEETLGELPPASPSTIIGKRDLERLDADLDLVTDDDAEVKGRSAGASHVFDSGLGGSGVLADAVSEDKRRKAFENLEELELDLAAESSRVLNPEEAAALKKQVADAKPKPPAPDSDLELNELGLAGADEGTDPVPTTPAAKSPKPGDSGPSSDLELATDEDDFVLAESGGSDITLDSADSGINLVDPSDSGLALDDIPLEAGGSAILDSLSGVDEPKKKPRPADSEISLVASDSNIGEAALGGVQTDDDFRLTPMGDLEEDADSSSQVIALDGGLDDLNDEGLGGEAFVEDEAAVGGDFGGGDEFAAAAYGGPVVRPQGEYTLWNVLFLGSTSLLLLFTVLITTDLLRNVWSWNQNIAVNDSLVQAILGLFGKQ